jgi:hypothetical protein
LKFHSKLPRDGLSKNVLLVPNPSLSQEAKGLSGTPDSSKTENNGHTQHDPVNKFMGLQKIILVGDIAIQLETEDLCKLTNSSSVDLFGDDLDFSSSQWSKLESLWSESVQSKNILGKLSFFQASNQEYFPELYVIGVPLQGEGLGPSIYIGTISKTSSYRGREYLPLNVDLSKDSNSILLGIPRRPKN